MGEYVDSEWVPPLSEDDLTRLAYSHWRAVQINRTERCSVCSEVWPCATLRLAVEVLGRREVAIPGLTSQGWEEVP